MGAMARADADPVAAGTAAERVLVDLLALEREVLELDYVRRSDALERVSDAIRRLGEMACTDTILDCAAAELGTGSEFERVLISEVADNRILPLTIWAGEDQAAADAAVGQLARTPIRLEYPLLEYEVARRHGAEVVSVATAGARTPASLKRCLGWDSYVVAALTVGGETIGLLHADAAASAGAAATARAVDELDAEVAARYAEGLSGVLERAVLRHTLELHRVELSTAVQWMSNRLSRLEDASGMVAPRLGDTRQVQTLTQRELEVVRLLARGNSNRAIARALVIREGTVKYHVKNILRKLGATSRADAVARFVRAAAAEPDP